VHSAYGTAFVSPLLLLAFWSGWLGDSDRTFGEAVRKVVDGSPITFVVFWLGFLAARQDRLKLGRSAVRSRRSLRGFAVMATFASLVGIAAFAVDASGIHGWPGRIYTVPLSESVRFGVFFAIAIFLLWSWQDYMLDDALDEDDDKTTPS